MKNKRSIFLIYILVILLAIAVCFIFWQRSEFLEARALEKVIGTNEMYCNSLENAFHSNDVIGKICATCGADALSSYLEVDCEDILIQPQDNKYCIKKTKGGFIVKINIPLAWGGRNDNPGTANLEIFVDNKNGHLNSIVNADTCKY